MMKEIIYSSILSLTILNGCAVVAAGAVASTTAIVVTDPRTSAQVIADNQIEAKLKLRYLSSTDYPNCNIYIHSYNGVVLLTGQAQTQALADKAEFIAKTIPGVRKVYNYLTIRLPQSIAAKTQDSLITTTVKARIFGLKEINSNSVKVITTNSVVYLFGIVTETEASLIAKEAAKVDGVSKVITLFEYVVK